MATPEEDRTVAGLCDLISFVSIRHLVLYIGVHDPNFIVGPGPDTPVLIGGVLDDRGLGGLGTAVALYPVAKRQNEGMALASSAPGPSRGWCWWWGWSVLTVVTLRQAGVGPEGLVAGHALLGV